jgi:KH domain
MEITGAKVHVSSADEVYPGTNDRIVLISGSDSSVSSAQALIWQLLAQNFRAIEAVRLPSYMEQVVVLHFIVSC